MNEELPSINDFIEDISQLPSVSEEVESVLPSVEDYIEKEEEVLTEETVVETNTDSTEIIVSLIESVRNSIPEVKSYDKELYELMHLIEEVRKEIPVVPEPPEIPEVRYYDDQIEDLKESIVSVRDSIPYVPEVKYYDEQISELQESIEEVKERDIPDFRWISKAFSIINEDFDNLSDTLATLKGRLDLEVNEIVESLNTSSFETGVDVKRLDESISTTKEEVTKNIFETKEKIWKELKETSLRIWNLNKEYKADSKELRKETKLLYKELGQQIVESIKTSDTKIDKLNEYFEHLIEEVNQLPEVKYYDEQISEVSESVESVRNLVEVLERKLNKKIAGLKESILVVPPTENNTDPLTPLDQNFATLDDLSNHYRTFLNRIQQQLATLGGGGEVRLEFLDDIDRDTAKVNGKFLKYDSSIDKWVGATGGGGASFSGTSGQILQHNGSEYVGVSSVGIATFINDYHQGYYRYSTNYYTTGVANTVQNLPADEFVMIQPSVRTNKVDFLPEKMLIANSNVPWIGAGATIGTGQTQFSLAGLDDGSTVIVRIAAQVDPDVDNTNVDFALNFTTNPTTQGYGTTNFSITKEQALICNEGADQNYISETLFNFYVGSSLSGSTTATAGSFNLSVRSSDECDFEMMALTINVVA